MPEPQSGFQVGGSLTDIYETYVEPMMRPFVAALIGACVRVGDDVLDVACGTGFATRAAMVAAGPEGSVTGVDINPAMISAAAANVAGPVTWLTASALDLPLEEDTFDVAVCQQGLQFFPDPVIGLAEMRRVTRPGGRIGATIWAPRESSPYLSAQLRLLDGYADPVVLRQAVPPDGVEQMIGWADAAGMDDVEVRQIVADVVLPPLDSYLEGHLRALPFAAPFLAAPEPERRAALARMEEELAPWRTDDGGAAVPVGSVLLTATST